MKKPTIQNENCRPPKFSTEEMIAFAELHPDIDQLLKFCETLRSIEYPEVTSVRAGRFLLEVKGAVDSLVKKLSDTCDEARKWR